MTHSIWWQNPALWRDPYTYSDISRPTEDSAIQSILTASLIARGAYRIELSNLERDVEDAFNRFKKARSGYPDIHYIQQTAMRLKMPVFQIRSILSDIAFVKRNHARAEAHNIIVLPHVINRMMTGA